MDIKGLDFVRGVELADGSFFLASQDPDLNISTTPHSGIVVWTKTDGWTEVGMAPRITVDMTVAEDAKSFLMLDPLGTVTQIGNDGQSKTQVTDENGTAPTSEMRCIRCIGKSVHIGGMGRLSFARSEGGVWEQKNTPSMEQFLPPTGFSGIDGMSETEVYAAGWAGELWTYNGDMWRQIQSPTNVILNDIAAGPEHLAAVGLAGQVIFGRKDNWDVVEHDATGEPFWSVRAFNGAFYLSTIGGIFKLEDGELTPFRRLDDGMRTAYSLTVGPSGLWSIGGNDICLFDGDAWHTIAQS